MTASIVHIPFLGTAGPETIKRQLAEAPLRCPGAIRYAYTPPQPYEYDGQKGWSFPEITAYFK